MEDRYKEQEVHKRMPSPPVLQYSRGYGWGQRQDQDGLCDSLRGPLKWGRVNHPLKSRCIVKVSMNETPSPSFIHSFIYRSIRLYNKFPTIPCDVNGLAIYIFYGYMNLAEEGNFYICCRFNIAHITSLYRPHKFISLGTKLNFGMCFQAALNRRRSFYYIY